MRINATGLRSSVTAAAAVTTALVVVALAAAAAPTNDTFPGTTLGGASGSIAGTLDEATIETGEPDANGIPTADPNITSDLGGRSVWYTWIAPSTGTFHFCAVPGVNDFSPDTVLGVWTGSAVDGLTEVAFNDDAVNTSVSRDSHVAFAATSGATYHIGVGEYGGDEGPFTLEWGTVECAAPNTVISAAKVQGKRVTLTLTAVENTNGPVTFACKVDAGPFAPCSTPATFRPAGGGAHTFTVRATDAAGNVEDYPASVTVQTKGPAA
jgi:hypothetical protein